MSVYSYTVLTTTTDSKKPFFDEKKGIFYMPTKKKYRYFLECGNFNKATKGTDYFILLSDVKFHENCRLCRTDDYWRCQIKVKGDIRDFIKSESADRGNVDVEYVETIENYDVYSVE